MWMKLILPLAALPLAMTGTGWSAPVTGHARLGAMQARIVAVQDHWKPSDDRRDRRWARPGTPGFASSLRSDSPAFGYEYRRAPYYGPQPLRPRVIVPRAVEPKAAQPRVPVGVPQPWTAQWYAYCAEKYRSFDRRTGSFVTYAGRRRLCR